MAGHRKTREQLRAKAKAERVEKIQGDLATTLRRAEALNLRRRGWSYSQIGAMMGITKQSAHELVQKALAEMVLEPTEDLLKLEACRLDEMQTGHYEKAVSGDIQSTATVLNIQSRRARLFGLDAPVKQELAGEMVLNLKEAAADEARSRLAALVAGGTGAGVARKPDD